MNAQKLLDETGKWTSGVCVCLNLMNGKYRDNIRCSIPRLWDSPVLLDTTLFPQAASVGTVQGRISSLAECTAAFTHAFLADSCIIPMTIDGPRSVSMIIKRPGRTFTVPKVVTVIGASL